MGAIMIASGLPESLISDFGRPLPSYRDASFELELRKDSHFF